MLRFHALESAFGVTWGGKDGYESKRASWRDPVRAGMPRVNDGALLFLQTMLGKMKAPDQAAAASPSSSTARRSRTATPVRESEIRRWILENDWLDAIVMLPISSSITRASLHMSGSCETTSRQRTRVADADRCSAAV